MVRSKPLENVWAEHLPANYEGPLSLGSSNGVYTEGQGQGSSFPDNASDSSLTLMNHSKGQTGRWDSKQDVAEAEGSTDDVILECPINRCPIERLDWKTVPPWRTAPLRCSVENSDSPTFSRLTVCGFSHLVDFYRHRHEIKLYIVRYTESYNESCPKF